MKTSRTAAGPFLERPYFSDREVEAICEEALRATGLFPTSPGPIRIERFLEKRFNVVPEYEDLSSGVLGYTVFGKNGVQAIYVNRSLAEEDTKASERRVRTTMAHEGGHGLLHAHLFALEASVGSLFENSADISPTRILCRDQPSTAGRSERYDGRWWEVQANKAMASLLLPERLVVECLESFLEARGSLGGRTLPDSKREPAARQIADSFDVNPIVARLRLARVCPLDGGQMAL